VTGCDFLAYSCAAARELHPLPYLRHQAKTHKPKDISKNRKDWFKEFTGRFRSKSNRIEFTWSLCNLFLPVRGLSDKDQTTVWIFDVELDHAVIALEQITDVVAVFECLHVLP